MAFKIDSSICDCCANAMIDGVHARVTRDKGDKVYTVRIFLPGWKVSTRKKAEIWATHIAKCVASSIESELKSGTWGD